MNLAIRTSFGGSSAPKVKVSRPHVIPIVSAMWVVAAMVSTGCSSDSQVTHPTIVGMTDTTPPYYSVGETTLYEVQVPVPMPMRAPDADEAKTLGAPAAWYSAFGATTAPWAAVDDVQTTVRFTITNLDDETHAVELLVDPWNPQVIYKPGIEIVSDEETVPDLSGYDRYYVLDKSARLVGTLIPDDTRELAVDLATVMNIQTTDASDPDGNGLFNHTFNLQNRSTDGDALIQKFIPDPTTIPAMVGFTLGLRTLTPMNVAVEVTVDIQDISGKRVMPTGTPGKDDVALMMPTATLAPPAVVPEMD
jgi:hypothetical protein